MPLSAGGITEGDPVGSEIVPGFRRLKKDSPLFCLYIWIDYIYRRVWIWYLAKFGSSNKESFILILLNWSEFNRACFLDLGHQWDVWHQTYENENKALKSMIISSNRLIISSTRSTTSSTRSTTSSTRSITRSTMSITSSTRSITSSTRSITSSTRSITS